MSILQIKTPGESPRLQAVGDAAHGIVESFMINKLYDTYQRRFGGCKGRSQNGQSRKRHFCKVKCISFIRFASIKSKISNEYNCADCSETAHRVC